jgi:hypothetical protein
VSTKSLRRQLEELKKRGGHGDCPGCGYPSYRGPFKIITNVRTLQIDENGKPYAPESPPKLCEVCGREKLRIKMKGLSEKSQGSSG